MTTPMVPLSLVRSLRDRTGRPLKECKEVLAACANDLDAAVQWLSQDGSAGGTGSACGMGNPSSNAAADATWSSPPKGMLGGDGSAPADGGDLFSGLSIPAPGGGPVCTGPGLGKEPNLCSLEQASTASLSSADRSPSTDSRTSGMLSADAGALAGSALSWHAS